MPIDLNINGKQVHVDAEPDTPLLWVLRDELKLTGTKYGCGQALCGACTVHADGRADPLVPDERQPTPRARRSSPSRASREAADVVRAAWRELDVPQCGYCQSGQIMSAAALLAGNPSPSDADIDDAMDGNVCRCATYHRIRAGIHRAAEIMKG